MTAGVTANQRTIDRITPELDRLRDEYRDLRAREGALRNEIRTAGTDDPRYVARDTITAAAAADTTPVDLAAGTRAAHTRDRTAQGTAPGAATHRAETPGTTSTDTTATVDETITAPAESGSAPVDAVTGGEAAARRVLELVLTEGGGRDGELGERLEVIRAWFGPDAVETRRAEYAGVQYRLGHAEKLMALFENEPGSGGHARAQTVLAEVRADLDTANRALAAAEHAAAAAGAATTASAATGVPDPAAAIADEIATAHTDPARAAEAGVFDTAEAVLTDPAAVVPGGGEDGRATAAVVQDALDLAGVGETIDWGARGAAAFDPATPLTLPDPAGDGVFLTATRRLGRRARTEIADAWRAGAREALAAATDDERRAAIAVIGGDERVREATLGRRSTDLPTTSTGTDPFAAAVHTAAGEYTAGAEPLRHAAVGLLLGHTRGWQELGETAATAWRHTHGELMWPDPGTGRVWQATVAQYLREDPLVGTWAGWPAATRHREVEAAVTVVFDRLTVEHPDLADAVAGVPQSRLAAHIRGQLIPMLHPADTPVEDRHPLFGAPGPWCRLHTDPDTGFRSGPRGWEVSFDGGAHTTEWGADHRVALGHLLDQQHLPIPGWVARRYRPAAAAVDRYMAAASAAAREHPAYRHTAHTRGGLWRNGPGNAVSNPYLRAARTDVVATLRRDHPADTATLDAAGFDLDWLLLRRVDPGVLTEIRTGTPPSTDAAVTVTTGGVVVGDPDDRHATLTERDGRLHLDGERLAADTTWDAALTTARTRLDAPLADTPPETESTAPSLDTGVRSSASAPDIPTSVPVDGDDITVQAESPHPAGVHEGADAAPAAEDTATGAAIGAAIAAEAVPVGRDFVLGTEVRVPSGARARVAANLAAAELAATLTRERRAASVAEQRVLAGWSGWGAVPEVFDNRPHVRDRWRAERGRLRELLGEHGFAAARATTLNAHYTDPAVVAVMWAAMRRAGLPDGAVVLEPGCGAGHFVGTAPVGVAMVGVEVEAVSAQIAHRLYPSRQVRNHGFERDFAPDATFTGVIGNVPFGKYGIYDPIHNAGGHSLHNHFILKSLALTAPGGYVTVLTSAFTSDARRTAARAAIAEYGDLLGAVRLPSGAFDRQAGTQVVTDVLVLRRRDPGATPTADTTLWAGQCRIVEVVDAKTQDVTDHPVNAYFAQHPDHVLGSLWLGHGLHGRRELLVHPHTGAPLAEALRDRLELVVDTAVAHGLGCTAPPPAGPDADRWWVPGLFTAADLDSGPVVPGVLRFDDAAGGFEQFRIGHGWGPVTCRGADKIAQWKVLVDLGETVLALTETGRDPESTRAQRDALRGRLNALYDGYLSRWGPLNRFTRTDPPPLSQTEIAARFTAAEKRWRIQAARADAVTDGADPDSAPPYDGPLPDPVAERLREQATRQRAPRKNQPHLEGAIARDPRLGMVLAVEQFTSRYDGSDAHTRKSPIFTEDTTAVRVRATHADTPGEAVTITVDELGHPDPARIAQLLGVGEAEALEQVQGLIYPALDGSGRWELAQVALSGHVRDKLAAARVAAGEDPHRYRELVTALENVVPPDVDPARIGVRPGAPWVPVEVYRQFLVEEFGLAPDTITVELDSVTGTWKIASTVVSRHRDTRGYPDRYGNHRVGGVELMELLANNRAVQVLKTAEELEDAPKPRFHPGLTEALRASATALEDRFAQWLWSDGDRHLALSRVFNDRHNSFVKPRFDATGKTFPGLNPKYRLYDYQAAAVVRFLHTEAILLDHVVGAGKTLTITASCMEAKRLGLVHQPWVVVPNHLLAQWSVEVREAYPNAKLLVAADLDGVEDRQRFIGQSAVTDWDLVIVAQSVFTKIPMTRQAQIDYLEGEVADMARALDEAAAAEREFSVKQIEAALKKTRHRIDTILGQKASDTGLTFEQSGCDFLYVDEAHEYKNLSRPSNSADLSVPDGSQRASDLEMKARYLREHARARNEAEGRPGAPAKAVCFATGTPISNAMSEIWVMTKFLRPDLLTDAGLGRIDNWAGTFARPVTNPEMNITGTKLTMVTRMSSYANVPQLVAMIDQYRDVVTADQIPVRLPVMSGGVPRNVEFDLGQHTVDFVADLDERLATLSGDTLDQDNTLKIATDGRNATMYPPLANLPTPAPENSRVEVAAELIWACYVEHADHVIPADRYGPDMTGVFQLVFCDRGTPKPTDTPHSRNVYTELRAALVRRGMAGEQVAFMHEHDTPKQKTALAEACRDGRIRVLITSTRKGGTGLNVQRALKQLVNMDPAWTAADMEQRIGRIIRQGNTFATVDVVNLVARRSYDAMMYQYVAHKAGFVAQIRREDVPATMDDLGGDFAASWAQTKAAATGDPVFVHQVEADQHVTSLLARRDVVHNTNAAREATIAALHHRITAATDALPGLRADSDRVAAWLGTDRTRRLWKFPDGRAVPDSEPADLVTALARELTAATAVVTRHNTHVTLAAVAGIALTVTYHQQTSMYAVALGDATPRYLQRDEVIDVLDSDSAARGLIQKIRNTATTIAERADQLESQLHSWRADLDAARAEPVLVFDQGDDLETAKLRAAELRLEVNSRENSPQALARHARDIERRRAAGQYPNWSLDLNPTPVWADRHHGTHPAAVAAAVPQRMQYAADTWAAAAAEREKAKQNQLWKPLDATEHEWRYGHDPDTGLPGARTWWADRQWRWEAYDGNGNRETGATHTRQEAVNTATRHAQTLARARDIDITQIDDAGRTRPHPSPAVTPTDTEGSAIGGAIDTAHTDSTPMRDARHGEDSQPEPPPDTVREVDVGSDM